MNPAGMLQGGKVFRSIRLVCYRMERFLGESGWYVAGWRGFLVNPAGMLQGEKFLGWMVFCCRVRSFWDGWFSVAG